MDEVEAISPDAAQKLLEQTAQLTSEEVVRVLRYLKRANEDLSGKVRQMKSEVGRLSRK